MEMQVLFEIKYLLTHSGILLMSSHNEGNQAEEIENLIMTIQNTEPRGERMSVMRAAQVIEQSLMVCSSCYSTLEFKFVFESERKNMTVREQCFLCEIGSKILYKVTETKTSDMYGNKKDLKVLTPNL